MWKIIGGVIGVVAAIILLPYLYEHLGQPARIFLAIVCIFVGFFGLIWIQGVKQKKGIKA